jgi:hypothetical protein
MTPYMSFTLKPFNDILVTFSNQSTEDPNLWVAVIECLTKSFNFDDGGKNHAILHVLKF